jgi:hypothetical protein
MKKFLPWILVLIPAFVFLQSLPFKFTGAAPTVHIFSTIGAWFDTVGLSFLASPFTNYGAYAVGSLEGIAAVLLLIPRTRGWGALLGLGLLSGAIFFHVATPLGVAVRFPGTDAGDPSLFIMAVIAWLCCAATLAMRRGAGVDTGVAQAA